MNASSCPRFFLGANSPRGFASLYDELIEPSRAKDVYVLKGGPGCGKSTLMRRVGAALSQADIPREEILCSSDPDSLDGVIFPSLGAALVDGTSPHVVECGCPAAVDIVVNLGAYYDREALRPSAGALRTLMAENHARHDRVTRCLSASRILREDLRGLLLPQADLPRLSRRAKGVIQRELKDAPRGGSTRRRFLTGATPKGALFLQDTVRSLCPRVFLLEDSWGFSSYFLAPLLEYAQSQGIETIVCCCPQDPNLRPEHLLFPTLGLAFVTDTPLLPWNQPFTRRLRIDPILPAQVLREHRSRLRFERKMADDLFREALDTLKEAKALHDQIEDIYRPHVDFDGVNQEADAIIGTLLRRGEAVL